MDLNQDTIYKWYELGKDVSPSFSSSFIKYLICVHQLGCSNKHPQDLVDSWLAFVTQLQVDCYASAPCDFLSQDPGYELRNLQASESFS